jgi:Acetyltransferase (GNAT) family
MPAQARPASESILTSAGEESLASLRREWGLKVVEHRGRHWMEAPRGFWQPVHWLARLRADEATMPRRFAWGYRATLRPEDQEAHANASVPVHILADVGGYDFEGLARRRRRDVRTCERRAQVVELVGPQLLRDQGFEVKRSAVERTKHGSADSFERYLMDVELLFEGPWQLVLAGIVGAELGGYLTGSVVDGTAYIDSVWIASGALRCGIGTAMVFEFVQACRRSHVVREIAFGLHSVDDRPLVEYKESLGFAVTAVPAKAWISSRIAPVVRRRNPSGFYRLTGASPARG